jgi:hypothetical protein
MSASCERDFQIAAGKPLKPNPAGLAHNSIIRQEMLQLRSEVMNMKSLLTEVFHCGDRYSKIKYYYQ